MPFITGISGERTDKMRFIHVADIHLGAAPVGLREGKDVRKKEIWETFERLIRVCKEEKPDFLLIAGDLFHRQPLLRDLKEADYLFSTIPDTRVVWIAGNHDYVKADSYYRSFTWSDNVYPLLGEEMSYLEFPELGTCIAGFSYHQKEITERRYERAFAPGRQETEILLAHGGDEKHIPFTKKELFDLGYDYIALGHIHKPEILIEGAAAYAGALEPVDKNDIGPHGYIEGSISNGDVKIRFIPFAGREYIHANVQVDQHATNGSVKERLDAYIRENGKENIYKFLLKGYRDANIRFDIEKQNCFGNIVEIIDETSPWFDYEELKAENRGNLLGRYIESFAACEPDSLEYRALYEGVQALLPQRR